MDKKYGNMPQYICLVFCHFSGSRLWWQQLKQENPDTPLPGQKLFLGETETFPGQPRDINSPVFPRSALGSPPRWACPKHLPREMFRRHPNQMPEPPQLTPLNMGEKRLYSEPFPDVQTPHPISKAQPSHPAKEAHFCRLYS